MSYNLVPGKLYTTIVKDYPIVYERTDEFEFGLDGLNVSQIYLQWDSTLLYTGKIYRERYYEFLYYSKFVYISYIDFIELKEP